MKPSGRPRIARAVAVLALLAVLTTAACSRGASDGLPTITAGDISAQNAYAHQTTALVWPAGFRPDPTGTFCANYSTRCAQTRLSPRAAVTALSAAFAAVGLTPGPPVCGNAGPEPMELPGVSTPADGCSVTIAHGHALMKILAWNRFTLTKASGSIPARTLDLGRTAVSLYAPPVDATPAATLPGWSSAPIDAADRQLVGRWVPLTCTAPIPHGCARLSGPTAVVADPVSAAQLLAHELTDAGFGIESATCDGLGVQAPHIGCRIMAIRQHSQADVDRVTVVGEFTDVTPNLVMISGGNPPD